MRLKILNQHRLRVLLLIPDAPLNLPRLAIALVKARIDYWVLRRHDLQIITTVLLLLHTTICHLHQILLTTATAGLDLTILRTITIEHQAVPHPREEAGITVIITTKIIDLEVDRTIPMTTIIITTTIDTTIIIAEVLDEEMLIENHDAVANEAAVEVRLCAEETAMMMLTTTKTTIMIMIRTNEGVVGENPLVLVEAVEVVIDSIAITMRNPGLRAGIPVLTIIIVTKIATVT